MFGLVLVGSILVELETRVDLFKFGCGWIIHALCLQVQLGLFILEICLVLQQLKNSLSGKFYAWNMVDVSKNVALKCEPPYVVSWAVNVF